MLKARRKSSKDNLLKKQYKLEKELAQKIKSAPAGHWTAEVAQTQQLVTALQREIRAVAVNEDLCLGTTHRTVRLIKKIIGRNKSVIDIGCGTGLLVRSLAASQAKVVGVDICSSLIETATANASHLNNTQFLCTSIEEAPFAPQSFDAACSIAVLEHLHPGALGHHVSRIYSLLRPGGIFIIQTPNRLDGPHDVSRHFVPLGRPAEGLHLREYTKRELVTILKTAGFRDFRCTMWPARLYERLPWNPSTRTGFIVSLICETVIEHLCPILLRPLAVHVCCNGLLVCQR